MQQQPLVKDFIGQIAGLKVVPGTDRRYFEPVKGDVGIEVEMELRVPIPEINNAVWSTKNDGSLRNYGYEFITKKPLADNGKKLEKIKGLFDELEGIKHHIIQDCPRTSVHTHINLTELDIVQAWTGICAYYLVENLLYKYCGEEREGNVFCLRLKDAEAAIDYMQKDLKSLFPFNDFYTDRLKYLGGNLNAIPRFGSFEVRGMRGVYDPIVIDNWTTQVNNIFKRANKLVNPAVMMDIYFNNGPDAILNVLFDKPFIDTLKMYAKDWEKLIDQNVGLICEVCYVHDWSKYRDKVSEVFMDVKPKDNKVVFIDPMADQPRPVRRVRANPFPPIAERPAWRVAGEARWAQRQAEAEAQARALELGLIDQIEPNPVDNQNHLFPEDF